MTDGDFDELVADNSPAWLAGAAAMMRALDPAGFDDDTTFHVVDVAAVNLPLPSAMAWTMPALDVALRPWLRDRRPGPVAIVDVPAVVRSLVPREDLPDEHLAANCRLAVAAIVLHEFGHARVSEAAGKSFGFQPTRAMIAQALQADTSPEENHELHGPPWLRAYLHLSARAAARCWPGRYWLDVALNEIEHRYRLQRPAGIFDVLEDEIESFAADRLVDILRRPAPIELASTYQARAAGRTLKG